MKNLHKIKTDGKRYIIGGYNNIYGYNRAYTILDNPVTTLVSAPVTTLITSPSYVYAKRSEEDENSPSESSGENAQSGDKNDEKRAVFLDYYQPMTYLTGSHVTLLDNYQRSYFIGKRDSPKDEHNVHADMGESQEETSSVRPRDISSSDSAKMNGQQRNEKPNSRPSQHMPMNSNKNQNQKNGNAPGQNQRNN